MPRGDKGYRHIFVISHIPAFVSKHTNADNEWFQRSIEVKMGKPSRKLFTSPFSRLSSNNKQIALKVCFPTTGPGLSNPTKCLIFSYQFHPFSSKFFIVWRHLLLSKNHQGPGDIFGAPHQAVFEPFWAHRSSHRIFTFNPSRCCIKSPRSGHTKTQVNADIVNRLRTIAFYDMQRQPLAYLKPHTQRIIKRVFKFFGVPKPWL